MRDFNGKPYLGTYTPQDYYNLMLQVDPLNAEKETKEACFNSGTSQYNPLNQRGTSEPFAFNPIPDEKLNKIHDDWWKAKQEQYKQMEITEMKATIKEFEKSIWYKIYKFFGGY